LAIVFIPGLLGTLIEVTTEALVIRFVLIAVFLKSLFPRLEKMRAKARQ
jgi:hypothetical protein